VLEHEAFPSQPLAIDGSEVMAAGYRVVWFLYKDCPYDIGRFYRPDGAWTGYYVDILEPVRWEGSDPETLEPIVDLFLDLWITPEGRLLVLDEDEFEEAERRGYLTPEQARHARAVVEELVRQTEAGSFPPATVQSFSR
jgi:predicted RNA-binding protein associated with RNAse of E/G family